MKHMMREVKVLEKFLMTVDGHLIKFPKSVNIEDHKHKVVGKNI